MFLKKKRKNLYGNSCYNKQMSKSERIQYINQQKSQVLRSAFGKKDINIKNKEISKLKKLNLNTKNKNNFKIKKQKNVQNLKENSNKNAYIETQLVSLPNFNENRRLIDVKKIIDFHKTLKRTYAKRKTLSKAFQNWDIGKKGYLNHNDIKRIGERFNMQLNQKEIELLFILSSGNNDCKLQPKQFISLIADQQFHNIDYKKSFREQDLRKLFQKKYQQQQHNKQQNKLLEFFQFQKKNILKILNDRSIFKDKNYQIDKEQFIDALGQLKIDEKFLNKDNKNFLFNINQKNGKVNFLDFANQIFDFSSQHNYFRCEDDQINSYENHDNIDLQVDPKSLTLNKIEFLFKNLHKIRGRMKKNKLNKNDFEQQLQEVNQPLNKKNVIEFLKQTFQKNKINFKDNEIQVIIRGFNFDENLIYNKKDLSETLFKTNMEDFIQNQKKRVFPKIDSVRNNVSVEVSNSRMQQIQKDLDEKFFMQNKTQYNIYKTLDENKDNKISDQEFETYLTQNNICNEGEALALLDKLNIKENAFLQFNDFMRALHQNQLQAYNINKGEQVLNGTQFQENKIQSKINKIKNLDKFYENLKEQRRVKNLQNNCKLKRFQLQRQIQVYTSLQEYFYYNKTLTKKWNVLK